MKDYGHFIGGKHVAGTSKRYGDVWNPSTGRLKDRVILANASDLNSAVEVAKQAQPAWANTNPQRRARVLMRFIDLINSEMDSLAALLSSEHGKTIIDAKGDIQRGVEAVGFTAVFRT
jgi:malonate-semialdehyde dehydrogenase (acetylating)/methylmalonate-semialdehyde dehydrogenase